MRLRFWALLLSKLNLAKTKITGPLGPFRGNQHGVGLNKTVTLPIFKKHFFLFAEGIQNDGLNRDHLRRQEDRENVQGK